jgi:hypothetical protein
MIQILQAEMSNILKEKWIDGFDYETLYGGDKEYFELYKNPDSKEIKDCGDRGVISPEGSLYMVGPAITADKIIHDDLLTMLEKRRIIKWRITDWHKNSKSFDDFLCVYRDISNNNFYLSESYNESLLELARTFEACEEYKENFENRLRYTLTLSLL